MKRVITIVSVLFISQLAIAGAIVKVNPSKGKVVLPARMQAMIAQKLGIPWARAVLGVANDSANRIAIGIDLGTTNSAVSVVRGKELEMIRSESGLYTTPSVVSYKEDGKVDIVGDEAYDQMSLSPELTIYSAKRFMGKDYKDVRGIEVPYEVVADGNGRAAFKVGGKEILPQQVAAAVLAHVKDAAERQLGEAVTDVVITVPAYFGDSERTATVDAGAIAGLNVIRTIDEPTAAAIAYNVQGDANKKILVYDLGGGTFDISVLEGSYEESLDDPSATDKFFEVVGKEGDSLLGGDNFDEKLASLLTKRIEQKHDIKISEDSDSATLKSDILKWARATKETLSNADSHTVRGRMVTDKGNVRITEVITRYDFEQQIEDLIAHTKELTIKAVEEEAKYSLDEIDDVLLVGGSTKIPAVRKMLENLFGKPPNHSVDPDRAVAQGAAILASDLTGQLDTAFHGSLQVLDNTSISLGIETKGDTFAIVVPKGTRIPDEITEQFYTTKDNQTEVDIQVYQGERPRASKNKLIGTAVLKGLRMAPAGETVIDIIFSINADSRLAVLARDQATGKEVPVKIESSIKLSAEEIERMQKDASDNEQSDAQHLELFKLKEEIGRFVIEGKRLVDEQGEKISSTLQEELNALIGKAERAVASDDLGQIQEARDNLEKKIHEVGEQLTSSSSSSSSDSAKSSESSDNSDSSKK